MHTSIDPATSVGSLTLAVGDLARSIAFYTQILGFTVIQQDDDGAVLGVAGEPLLALTEVPGASPAPQRSTGLYHFAILVPSRADLGNWLRHWLALKYPLPGQADHLVSEALYLSDPDRNGIEIYRDRPRDEWRWRGGQVVMATDPLDIAGLLAAAPQQQQAAWAGFAPGTRIGHMHLQVGDIDQAQAFYHDVLGFDVVAQMPTALFVSAGGYHHHIGMNIWHSRGAGPAPARSAGLRSFTLLFADDTARQAVVARVKDAGLAVTETAAGISIADPWQNVILLQIAGAAPQMEMVRDT